MTSSVVIEGAVEKLTALGRQMPFALSLALTRLAQDGKAAGERALVEQLDNPTPFTRRSVAITPARKSFPIAEVFVKDVQAEYLKWPGRGGVRTPEPGKPVILPGAIRTNVYGNIPRGAVKREAAKGNVFIARRTDPRTAHLPPGLYRRTKRGLRLLVSFRPRAVYRPQLAWSKAVVEAVRRNAGRRLREAAAQALATARRP